MQRKARPRCSRPRELFHDNRRMQPVASAAAILVGDRGQEKPGLSGGEPDGARHNVVLFPLRVVRRDLTLDETAHLIAVKLMLFGKQRSGQHGLILNAAAAHFLHGGALPLRCGIRLRARRAIFGEVAQALAMNGFQFIKGRGDIGLLLLKLLDEPPVRSATKATCCGRPSPRSP